MIKFRNIFQTALIGLVCFVLYTAVFSAGAAEKTDYMKALSILKPRDRIKAKDFVLRDLNRREVQLKDHREKIVFINFWATWCPPCRREMPSMEKLYGHFKNRDFSMLAINIREKTSEVKAFKKKFKLTFPILLDFYGQVALAYRSRRIPVTYIIDREGYLIGTAFGARDWASDDAIAFFEQLLNRPQEP
jgi:thiol-disulfide isomerase/thioredoxin